MPSNPIHGREGVLLLSTAVGSTQMGTELSWTNSWSWTPSKDQTEISPLNSQSKYYVEGLVSGAVSAEGSFVARSSMHHVLISRFARNMICDTTAPTIGSSEAAALTDGNMYLHLIAKPIDTGGSSDEVAGAKFVIPILASGFSAEASGGDIVSWSYDGQQNGDAYYVESTDTAMGLPLKAV